MDLVVQLDERDGWAVARVAGDLDLTTAPRLREQVVQVVIGGQPRVVLDLQSVDFIDSTGLGVLVGLLKRTRSHGGDLRVVSTRPALQKIIEMTALDRALPLAATVDAALVDPGADAMGRTILLQIPPRNDHLALVRRVVATAAAAGDELPARRIDDLSLAVSEACANAIDAQRAIDADAPVAIVIELDEGVVAVTITDHAGGFSPDDVDPIPSVDDPGRLGHEHGLGLPLMRSLSESVSFKATDDGTAVRIEVHRPR